ncbi:hypothetical protein HanXRQr2_Chr04g0174451 [Helianthus annuus]|uniref:Uncharacterized protein n=1 Tax=Helianthus annuus TaxID=4232 RepID=A0A9K3NSF5_HELAN|nr:hypothetical protein HanXRQr2_Chr04g0174451 [Helianthus annuus]KAJ0931965.1 hypothetical protein HanPSC8_Chr04g0168091 [Helianthus annuus]
MTLDMPLHSISYLDTIEHCEIHLKISHVHLILDHEGVELIKVLI